MLTYRTINRIWHFHNLSRYLSSNRNHILATAPGISATVVPYHVVFKFQFHTTQFRMAGHNKWSKIGRKKMAADTVRSTMISRFVQRIRGHVSRFGNSEENPELKTMLTKGRELQIPKATLERALRIDLAKNIKSQNILIKGPSNYMILVAVSGPTTSINQSRSEIKKIVKKHNLSMLQTGTDASFFVEKGIIDVAIPESADIDLEELAIEIGAEDYSMENSEEYEKDFWQFKTDLESFTQVSKLLREKGCQIMEQRTEYFPRTHSDLTANQFEEATQVVEKFNGLEDATGVFDNITCKELEIEGSAISY